MTLVSSGRPLAFQATYNMGRGFVYSYNEVIWRNGIPCFPLATAPICQFCLEDAEGPFVTEGPASTWNNGRPYYRCHCRPDIRDAFVFDDSGGIDEENAKCDCGFWSRSGIAGPHSTRPFYVFSTCPLGRCNYWEWGESKYCLRAVVVAMADSIDMSDGLGVWALKLEMKKEQEEFDAPREQQDECQAVERPKLEMALEEVPVKAEPTEHDLPRMQEVRREETTVTVNREPIKEERLARPDVKLLVAPTQGSSPAPKTEARPQRLRRSSRAKPTVTHQTHVEF